MHNKLFVADNVLSISGGRNMADEYFTFSANSNFVDLDVLSAGTVVQQLCEAFGLYWNSVVVYPLTSITSQADGAVAAGTAFDASADNVAREQAIPARDLIGQHSVSDELIAGRLTLVGGTAQVLVDDPIKATGRNAEDLDGTVTQAVVKEFEAARFEVIVISPYFVPTEAGIAAMRDAINRKVRVAVITNSVGSTDEPLVYAAYAKRRVALLQAGVELYEINPEAPGKTRVLGDFKSSSGALHTKAALVDRKLSYVGSMNLDGRSAHNNTEIGLIINSPALAQTFWEMLQNRASSITFRLRLNAYGQIEWVSTQGGRSTIYAKEPNLDSWMRLKLLLLSPLVPESAPRRRQRPRRRPPRGMSKVTK